MGDTVITASLGPPRVLILLGESEGFVLAATDIPSKTSSDLLGRIISYPPDLTLGREGEVFTERILNKSSCGV